MRFISALLLASASFYLSSCSVIAKDKAQIEQIADDLIDEVVEDAAKLSA